MPVACPSCGCRVAEKDAFCPGCGTRLSRPAGSGSPPGNGPGTNILASIPWNEAQFARYEQDIPWEKKTASPPPRPAGGAADGRTREPGACRTCGSPLEKDKNFCIRCGKAAGADRAATRPVHPGLPSCPACGRQADFGDRFCEGCGAPVEQAQIRPPPGSCPQCGAGITAGRKFCEQCGAPFPPSRR